MRIDIADAVGNVLKVAHGEDSIDLPLRKLSDEEQLEFLERLAETQRGPALHLKAGDHRLMDWANGWSENLREFIDDGSPERLIPKYFGKYPEVRLNGRVLLDTGTRGELSLLRTLQSAALRYARSRVEFDGVCEFGAGTGHNLLHYATDRSLRFVRGYEWSWSGVKCIRHIGERLDPRISGFFFDYYAPGLLTDADLSAACVITIASLEQIGGNFRPFLEFLKKARPRIVINIEPIRELMGNGPLAELSKDYAAKRNYLAGYYDYLKNLQLIGEIEIMLEQESLIGSKFINGYGAVVWRWA